VMPLFKDACEDVRIEQWAPGARSSESDGGLSFSCWRVASAKEVDIPAAVLAAAAHCEHFSARVGTGVRMWVKEGHLRSVQPE